MDVAVCFTKSLEQNASDYFESAKKAKKKLETIKEVIATYEAKKEELLKKEVVQEETAAKSKKKLKWYQKFRWFKTSDGFLVIGGRDASTNEAVIKKYTEPHDLVFHTDMAGSPFFVLKTEGKTPGEATLREVADATCTFSRAWKLGLGSQSVFCVKPEQVSKEAKAGEFLTKGAFMIYGKTQYIENSVNLAIGKTQEDEVMAGPEEAVAQYCASYVTLAQGDEKVSTIAKFIQKNIGGDLDEIIRSLPAGSFKVLEIKGKK